MKQRPTLTPEEMVNQSREYAKNMGEVLKRIQVLQDQAKREKDIIRLNCVTDKVVQVRVNISIAEQSMAALQEAVTRADEGERTHEFTRLTIVNQKVLVLGAEAENCIGEDLSFVGATKRRRRDRPEHSSVRPHAAAGPRHRHRAPGRSQPADRLSVGPHNRPAAQPQVCAKTYLHEPTPRTVDRLGRDASRARALRTGQGEVTIGYQGLPYKASGESNTGIQVSEGVLMHVGAGAEAGYDTNVFYANVEPDRVADHPRVSCSATSPTRPGRAARRIASSSTRARACSTAATSPTTPALHELSATPGCRRAGLALSAGGGQFGFGIADTFARIEDPPYNSRRRRPITAYNNQASVGRSLGAGRRPADGHAALHEHGRHLPGRLRATPAPTPTTLMLDAAWKWLPKTAIFVNAQQGYIFYLNEAQASREQQVVVVSARVDGRACAAS